MSARIAIRPVRDDERAAWEPLWAGYLAFYKATIPPETTDVTWRRLHDDAEPMHVLGAYVDDRLTGIVHYISTAPPGRSATTAICMTCSSAKRCAGSASGGR